jgi:hypothetical protein
MKSVHSTKRARANLGRLGSANVNADRSRLFGREALWWRALLAHLALNFRGRSSAAKPGAALLVTVDPFFFTRRALIVTLAARYALPTVYFRREFAEIGGLVSYGTSVDQIHGLVGIYTIAPTNLMASSILAVPCHAFANTRPTARSLDARVCGLCACKHGGIRQSPRYVIARAAGRGLGAQS